jgi:ABC-type antimicrobial peptide transport system permease subunit
MLLKVRQNILGFLTVIFLIFTIFVAFEGSSSLAVMSGVFNTTIFGFFYLRSVAQAKQEPQVAVPTGSDFQAYVGKQCPPHFWEYTEGHHKCKVCRYVANAD